VPRRVLFAGNDDENAVNDHGDEEDEPDPFESVFCEV